MYRTERGYSVKSGGAGRSDTASSGDNEWLSSDDDDDEQSSADSTAGCGAEASPSRGIRIPIQSTTALSVGAASSLTVASLAISDSDLEIENDVPSLEEVLHWDIVKLLKPKEKRRQEVINGKSVFSKGYVLINIVKNSAELFHTERTHVRNLKVLKKLFYEPLVMQHAELAKILFTNLDEVLDIHSNTVLSLICYTIIVLS